VDLAPTSFSFNAQSCSAFFSYCVISRNTRERQIFTGMHLCVLWHVNSLSQRYYVHEKVDNGHNFEIRRQSRVKCRCSSLFQRLWIQWRPRLSQTQVIMKKLKSFPELFQSISIFMEDPVTYRSSLLRRFHSTSTNISREMWCWLWLRIDDHYNHIVSIHYSLLRKAKKKGRDTHPGPTKNASTPFHSKFFARPEAKGISVVLDCPYAAHSSRWCFTTFGFESVESGNPRFRKYSTIDGALRAQCFESNPWFCYFLQ